MANKPTHTGEKQVEVYGKKFTLSYGPKVHRAIHGDESNPKAEQHGVGLDANPELLIAEYDRLGGLILLNGKKVKTGTFWDFRRNRPVEKPVVEIQKRPKSKADSLENAGDGEKKSIFANEEDDEDEESDSESEEDSEEDGEEDDEDEGENAPVAKKGGKKK